MKKWIPYLIILILVILNIALICGTVRQKERTKEMVGWYTDSLNTCRDEMGRMTADTKTLQITNWRLVRDIDSLKEIAGVKPDHYTTVETVITIPKDSIVWKHDTIYITEPIRKSYNFHDEWYTLKGDIWCDGDEMGMRVDEHRVYAGMETYMKDGRVYVTTDNPYVTITGVTGVELKKERKIRFGAYVGFGATYGIINKDIDVGPSVGIGVNFSF